MNIGRTLNKQVGKELVHRVYKFSSFEELDAEIEIYQKYFKNSVQIQSHGEIDEGTLQVLKNLDKDNVVSSMDLKMHDIFLLTRESISKKLSEEERMKKKLNKESTNKTTGEPKQRKNGWTKEQLDLLWQDTAEKVADMIGKSANSVYLERSRYRQANPDFVVPECCIAKRTSDKEVEEIKLTEEQEKLLWSDTATNLSNIFNISARRINKFRYDFCKQNPDFVIPKSANFHHSELTNGKEKAKSDYYWDDTQNEFLWQGTTKEVAELLSKSENAIYHARRNYLQSNPTFVIPAISKFKTPKGFSNPMEEVKKEERKKVVKEALAKPAKQNKSAKQKAATTKKTNKTIKEIANLFNSLDEKPKRIKIGDIELEF